MLSYSHGIIYFNYYYLWSVCGGEAGFGNLFGDVPRSDAGYFLCEQKVTKNSLGDTPNTPEYRVTIKSYPVSLRVKRTFGHLIYAGYLFRLRLTAC